MFTDVPDHSLPAVQNLVKTLVQIRDGCRYFVRVAPLHSIIRLPIGIIHGHGSIKFS